MIKLTSSQIGSTIYLNPQHITLIVSCDNGGSVITLVKRDTLEAKEDPEEVARMCNQWYQGTYKLPSQEHIEKCQELTLKAREGDTKAAEELLRKLSDSE
jgi:uncharacterized protein YlzI (FlbEa/FlbD family)